MPQQPTIPENISPMLQENRIIEAFGGLRDFGIVRSERGGVATSIGKLASDYPVRHLRLKLAPQEPLYDVDALNQVCDEFKDRLPDIVWNYSREASYEQRTRSLRVPYVTLIEVLGHASIHASVDIIRSRHDAEPEHFDTEHETDIYSETTVSFFPSANSAIASIGDKDFVPVRRLATQFRLWRSSR